MKKIVTRMAPSPTNSFLHLGNLRTLLYNYFLAKKHGGKFLVRLEDTDRDRYNPEFLKYFKDTLDWLGIVPDFSYWNPDPNVGSFIQSERDYSKRIEFLIKAGFAYYAFDSKEELEILKSKGLKYDATTRASLSNTSNDVEFNSAMFNQTAASFDIMNRDSHVPFVVRFKVPAGQDITFTDEILGDITINTDTLDDKVLLKSNGIGSYHLCNVCDDHDMGVTHVLRGQEWISSTPFHILLYKAFDWDVPTFAHLPLIMNPDGKGKLNKRNASKYGIPIAPLGYTDDNGVYQKGWKDLGYEPQALINALALVGWNPGDDKEILSIGDIINSFSLDRVHKSGARFDMAKATWVNSQYIQHSVSDDFLTEGCDFSNLSDGQKATLITEAKKRCNFRKDFKPIVDKLFNYKENRVDVDVDDFYTIIGFTSIVKNFNGDWTFNNIDNLITQYAKAESFGGVGLKTGKLLGLLRKVVLYNQQGIDVKNSMFILGQNESINRLNEYGNLSYVILDSLKLV